jgi:glutathione peroxidase
MRSLSILLFVFSSLALAPVAASESLYDFRARTIDGQEASLAEYRGKVALVVNVASDCGFTPQYSGLQALFKKYESQGFVVLGFPSNEFGGQEPGDDTEIKEFCSREFGVTFPMFSKGSVAGPMKSPLYAWLTKSTGGEEVGWNFEKFLVGRDGKTTARFKSSIRPDSAQLVGAIEEALGAQP